LTAENAENTEGLTAENAENAEGLTAENAETAEELERSARRKTPGSGLEMSR